MSNAYSDTTTKRGLLQLCEKNCLLGDAGITGNTLLKAQFTAELNNALDEVWARIFQVGGKWQLDDSNHNNYPIITTNLVAGQRDYSFVADESGNIILEIYKVFVADQNGLFVDITPVDVPSGAPSNFTSGTNTTGQPNTYDKLGNGIFLDPIPSYNRTGGLKIYINREASYFTTSDDTKKPGFAGLFHEYLALRASYNYASTNGLSNVNSLERRMLIMMNDIMEYYKAREKDAPKVMKARVNNPH